jgi:acetoin utilization deacetylase AcuC-like enzyme
LLFNNVAVGIGHALGMRGFARVTLIEADT